VGSVVVCMFLPKLRALVQQRLKVDTTLDNNTIVKSSYAPGDSDNSTTTATGTPAAWTPKPAAKLRGSAAALDEQRQTAEQMLLPAGQMLQDEEREHATKVATLTGEVKRLRDMLAAKVFAFEYAQAPHPNKGPN